MCAFSADSCAYNTVMIRQQLMSTHKRTPHAKIGFIISLRQYHISI